MLAEEWICAAPKLAPEIINEFAGSAGDAMPWYFRCAGVGKLIGKRTWGGLVVLAELKSRMCSTLHSEQAGA